MAEPGRPGRLQPSASPPPDQALAGAGAAGGGTAQTVPTAPGRPAGGNPGVLRLYFIQRVQGGNLGLIHRDATLEKAGFFVGMLLNALQYQGIGLPLIVVDGKQQAVAAIQPGAIEIVPHLLDLSRAEIVCLQVALHFLESGDFGGVYLVIKEQLSSM